MATGSTKMSFNHYGKYGTVPQTQGKDMEVSQDMHLKMSKKIAQLTKVIYALNTRNDEHEAIVQNVKDQHEEEIQRIIKETKNKIEYYKNQINSELEQRHKIESLQQGILDYERQKSEALSQFEIFKTQAEEREKLLKKQHSHIMMELSQEVLKTKKEFESKLAVLDSIKEQYERDKQEALENLRKEQQKEFDELRDQLAMHDGSEKEKLEEKYREEIVKLSQKCQDLDTDKSRLVEEYEGKLNKAQSFYENELAALKDSQGTSNSEELSALYAEQEKMMKEFALKESQNKKRIDDLINQLSESEEIVEKYKTQLDQLHSSLENKDSHSEAVNKQLFETKIELTDVTTRLKEMKAELAAVRDRCDQQAKDLVKKSTEIGELEGTRLEQESMITDLQGQVNKLQDRVNLLENARQALEEKGKVQEDTQLGALRSLERALEDMSIDKKMLIEKYEREIKALKDVGLQREQALMAENEANILDLTHKFTTQAEMDKREADERMKQLKEEHQKQQEEERSAYSEAKAAAENQFENMKAELTSKLRAALDDVNRLEKIVKSSKQGLGSASSQISDLKESLEKLNAELDATNSELRTSKNKCTTLENEYEKLKLLHEKKMQEAQAELKTKLDQLSSDLDSKWRETLRKECVKLESELVAQKNEDKRAALAQLMKMKDEQVLAERQGWQNKVQDLLTQISELKKMLASENEVKASQMDAVRTEAEKRNKELLAEMLKSAEQYAQKIESLEKIHMEQMTQLKMQHEEASKELGEGLRMKHIEDMKSQMLAHKATLEVLKSKAEKEKQQELEAQREEFAKEMESFQLQLQQKSAEEMDEATREHSMQLEAARMELERAIEIARQKEAETAVQISDLRNAIRHREEALTMVEEEAKKLHQGLGEMRQELDTKGKEVLAVRREANKALRMQEEQLTHEHQEEVSNVRAEYSRDKQEMLSEFNQAQELLKEKILGLQIMLEEAEDRYNNRESRPEDLEVIEKLKEAIQEREDAIQKLVDEKRFYQMELINRETNFNKVFSASPNVGILNPRTSGKANKKLRAAERKHSISGSSPALSAFGSNPRLDPLPGSPFHDEKINRNKPLPPTSQKKFVK